MDVSGNPNAQPVKIDSSVRFSSIGGLKEHIRCLREMVLFPLMYPELFQKFNTRPAKGVLFHGPPGTGKTLLARALANECNLVGGRKVAFFMRKGADVMNKYYGESERNLRLLFQQANKMKPSIIFFDEMDALAPTRNSRDGDTHASVVATLLAEMDGLCDRGDVIVIGATNRPDAMDPAVRRAGRFDRELYFPPPEVDARRDILDIYTRSWQPRPSNETLKYIAKITTGYLGSDIKALCSEAVLKAVRRVYPQIYECEYKLLVDAKNVEVTQDDILNAMRMLVPAGARGAPQAARSLPPYCVPLLGDQLDAAIDKLSSIYKPLKSERSGKTCSCSAPSVFLVIGSCADSLLAPALLARLEPCTVRELSVATMHSSRTSSQEQAVISMFSECRRVNRSCVLFIRDLMAVWNSLEWKHGACVLLQLWRTHCIGDNTLLLATSHVDYNKLPEALQEIFPCYKDCVYKMREPTAVEVITFLKPILTEIPLVPSVVVCTEPPPPLPRAPSPTMPVNREELARRKLQEYQKLRQLRIILRNVCRVLTNDRRYIKFARPVNVAEKSDYLDIIKEPMDLGTMLTKVDTSQYCCAKEFLDDIDLICANALEYNPDRGTSDKRVRQEVCALRMDAHTMVSEEIDTGFELECQLIARRRRKEGGKSGNDGDLSEFCYLANMSDKGKDPFSSFKKPSRPREGIKGDFRPDTRKRGRIDYNDHETNSKRSKIMSKSKTQCKLQIRDGKSDPNPIYTMNAGSPARSPTPNVGNVIINKAELDDILRNNVHALRSLGLQALIDLYVELSNVVDSYSSTNDRTKLPCELRYVVARYISPKNRRLQSYDSK